MFFLSVTYIYKMIIIQTFTMGRWQIVVKTSEATKQRKTKNVGNLVFYAQSTTEVQHSGFENGQTLCGKFLGGAME